MSDVAKMAVELITGTAYRQGSADFRAPDLSPFGSDLYVVHHQMHGSISFTHEQPYIGTFFARNYSP